MGKHDVGTPKYIANKIKAKGLQKLRWYCQMCQKQCRDENGFKCHTTSESHQRQLLIFADNAEKYIDEFSKEFEEGYLELLSRQFGTKRVHANRVYQDYIADRNHLHMNSTQWETLTDFVKWLGREGKCVVDETEKGWFVQYIDKNPETIALQEALAKKEKMEKDDSERMMELIEKQIAKGKEKMNVNVAEPTELVRDSDNELLKFNLPVKKLESKKDLQKTSFKSPFPKTSENNKKLSGDKSSKNNMTEKRKLTALEEIIKEEEAAKKKKKEDQSRRKDNWLTENIVVKVVTNSLGEKYFNKKGYIKEVIDKYCAVVLIETGKGKHKLKLDQEHLETVIPNIGKKVKILKGPHRNSIAELKDVDFDKFCVSIVITNGTDKGLVLNRVPYENISKLHNY